MQGFRYGLYRTVLNALYFSGAHWIMRPLFGGAGAILVGGASHPAALEALVGELGDRGFAEVAILTGPPPGLEHAAMQSASAA